MDNIRRHWVGEKKKQEVVVELFANRSVGKAINWPFPPSLLSGGEGFGNSGCGAEGGRVFWA